MAKIVSRTSWNLQTTTFHSKNLTYKLSTLYILFSIYFYNYNSLIRPKHALHLTSNNCQNLVVIDSPFINFHTSKYWLCVDMMWYTIEQCACLHESYVECGFPRVWQNVRENYIKNFPVSQFQSQQAFKRWLTNSGLLCHSWTRKLLEKLTEMWDSIDRNLNGSQKPFQMVIKNQWHRNWTQSLLLRRQTLCDWLNYLGRVHPVVYKSTIIFIIYAI